MYKTFVPGSPCEKIVSFFVNSIAFRDTPAESRKACASKASFLLISRDGLVLLGVALGIPFLLRTLMNQVSSGILKTPQHRNNTTSADGLQTIHDYVRLMPLEGAADERRTHESRVKQRAFQKRRAEAR